MFSYYGIFTWLPKLLVAQGHTVVKTFEYVLWMIVAQLPGYLAAAALVEKIGRKATLAGFLAACAVCAWLFGRSVSPAELVVWGGLMSFFNLGAWGVLYTYTPELYPLRFRAFASGWRHRRACRGGFADGRGRRFRPDILYVRRRDDVCRRADCVVGRGNQRTRFGRNQFLKIRFSDGLGICGRSKGPPTRRPSENLQHDFQTAFCFPTPKQPCNPKTTCATHSTLAAEAV